MSGMAVRTNVFALNAHRNLTNVGQSKRTSAQRLSSGFRINSAADDAAGLAISEAMRAQIRGLDQASVNTQDAVGLVQTAEGAMSTVSEMIIRVRELMVQAANDTNTWQNREMIQLEIDHIMREINDVAVRTQFNTRTLLTGGLGGSGGGTASLVPLQWMIFEQARVVGLSHAGGTVGPTGLHPNPNSKNETSLRNSIIELQTQLKALGRGVGARLVASGDISQSQLDEMFGGFPHDFTPLVPHMGQSERQQVRNIQGRLEIYLRTALRTSQEIYRITQDQINALGGESATNNDGSNVFVQQTMEAWNDVAEGARAKLDLIQTSILGPNPMTRYPNGYLYRLDEIDDIASLYDIIGYLVGFPGPVGHWIEVQDDGHMEYQWVRPPQYRDWERDNRQRPAEPRRYIQPPPVPNPNYFWMSSAGPTGAWMSRSSPGEVWAHCVGRQRVRPGIPQPPIPIMERNPDTNPFADLPDVWAPVYVPGPIRRVRVYPEYPEMTINPAWLAFENANTDWEREYLDPPYRYIQDPNYTWRNSDSVWVRINASESGPAGAIWDPVDDVAIPQIRIDIPYRYNPVRNDEENPHDMLIPADSYGRTLNNLERLQRLSLDVLGTTVIESNAMWFQTGANSMQGMVMQLKGIHTGVLGGKHGDLAMLIDVRNESGVPISQQLEIIGTAESIINTQRAQLGAVQNRLEFTRQSVDVSSENLSAAESRVRNTDMAREMMRFTKAQVLQQAGISMLAQANQLPSAVLQLLM